MTTSADNVQSNFFVCHACGKTNWYFGSLPDQAICGGCIVEGDGPTSEIGAGGLVQINTRHECRRREFVIDVSLICAVVLVAVLGGGAAIVKNRRRKRSNQRVDGTHP